MMKTTHRVRRDCRLCRSTAVEKVLSLTPTPPANELLARPEDAATQDRFPLDLYFCDNCHHLQLLDIISPDRLFSNYVYLSGTSPVFRRHFQEYAARVIADYSIPMDSLVVDIGSNDGTLLAAFKEAGMRVQGVDPARKIALSANAAGIDTIIDFFNTDIAQRIKRGKGPAKVIVANNVFAHIDDLEGILRGVDIVLAADGVLVIEVSYLKDVIEKTLFDTIYHEHLDYHAVGPLQGFFARNGFRMIDVVAVDSHGGSIRVAAQKLDAAQPERPSVAAFIAAEKSAGLYEASTYRAFAGKISRLGEELLSLISSIKEEGKSIAGFGLPAKATTLMHQFRIGPDAIDYVVDDNPLKQGLYSPGYGIPITDNGRLRTDTPDYLIILAWNFAKPIMDKLDWYLDGGGAIIVPLPTLTVARRLK